MQPVLGEVKGPAGPRRILAFGVIKVAALV